MSKSNDNVFITDFPYEEGKPSTGRKLIFFLHIVPIDDVEVSLPEELDKLDTPNLPSAGANNEIIIEQIKDILDKFCAENRVIVTGVGVGLGVPKSDET